MKLLSIQSEKIDRALDLIYEAHKTQKRKYTNEAYIIHPISVAMIVNTVTESEDVLCAALFHDLLEDTMISANHIEREFGQNIRNIVQELTDNNNDGNRKVRKMHYHMQISNSCDSTQTIKLADMIDNSRSIALLDTSFAKFYMKEQETLLSHIHLGNNVLYQIIDKIITTYFKTAVANDTENVIGNFWR